MKDYFSELKTIVIKHVSRISLYATLIVVSVIGLWYTYNFAVDFSSVPVTFLYLLIYFAFFEIFDTYILKGINTLEELKNGNTAVAIFYLAIAVLILAVAVVIG